MTDQFIRADLQMREPYHDGLDGQVDGRLPFQPDQPLDYDRQFGYPEESEFKQNTQGFQGQAMSNSPDSIRQLQEMASLEEMMMGEREGMREVDGEVGGLDSHPPQTGHAPNFLPPPSLTGNSSEIDERGSYNQPEGGAEDDSDEAARQAELQVKQYIPKNARKDLYKHDDLDSVNQQQPRQQTGSKYLQDDGINQPKFNQRHYPGSSPKKKGQQAKAAMDEEGAPDGIQSHDQITVEIEMIDQSQKRRPSTTQSNDSPRRTSDTKKTSQTSPKQIGKHSVSPLNFNKINEGLQIDPKINQMQSLTERVGTTAQEDDQHSLNDRQDDGDDDQQSPGKLNSEQLSNKNQTESDEEEDDDDTGSLDSIDKLQNILNEINDQAIEHLKNEETDQALESLKRAEQILEDYTNEGKDVDRNMIIIILYNQACCYQRLSMLDDCSNYLDGTIFNLQQKLLNFEEQEEEIRDMIMEAEQNAYGTDKSKQRKNIQKHAYGYDDDDDKYMDNGADANPYEVANQDQYGLNLAKSQKKQSYNLSSLSIHNKGQFDDGLSAGGAQLSEQSQDFQNLNDVQEPPEHYDLNDPEAMAQIESSKKLSISQKLFKLRYLCKCHLQLCAVQSQLNKHKDALHHGQMASVYCQELIRNSKTLCESYIGEILQRKQSKEQSKEEKSSEVKEDEDDKNNNSKESEDNLGNKLKEHYYLEDDEKLLDVLIKNCHPILKDMLKQINNFNKYNELTDNSKKAHQRDQDILKGMRMEIANTEFDQELMQLIETKDQFMINLETKQNIERFKVYEAELRKKGYRSDQQLNQSSMKGDIFGQLEQDDKINRKNSRKSFGKKQAQQQQFVDEMAPNQAQFDLNKSNQKVEEHDVYFKNEDALNCSFNSVGTYGQNAKQSDLMGIGPQGYLNLRNNVKTVLVTEEEDDWIFNLNIGNVMHLQPLSSEQMNLHIDNSHELSRDAMLEKIILLTVSYFCVGTELRFLNNNSNVSEDKMEGLNKAQKDKLVEMEKEKRKKKELSEMWHAQALEASARFLPSECPLVAHVITNYQKHHSPALTIIPEDEELQEDLRVVRPLNDVKNDNINYYQIIRNHLKFERVKSNRQIQKKEKQQKNRDKINKVKNEVAAANETPQPNLNNPQAIQEPQKQNFLEPEMASDENIAETAQQQEPQGNIMVNDLAFDPSKEAEPFSPDTFDGEEFGKELMNEQQKIDGEEIDFYPQQDNRNDMNALSSDEVEAMNQLAEQRDQSDNVQLSGDQSSSSKMAAAKSMNHLKGRKVPKSPGTLQQSLSGTNFHNTQQYKIPSGMQYLQNKQDTQRSSGKIKIKKAGQDPNKLSKKDGMAARNHHNIHVNSTSLARIGSIKQRLKMMPSNKSTKVIKQAIPKKPMYIPTGNSPTKKLMDQGKQNQSQGQLQKKKQNFQNMKIPQNQMNMFSSTSKLITMKSISPQGTNQINANQMTPNQVGSSVSNRKSMASSKQLKQNTGLGSQNKKPPTQIQQRKASAGQSNQMSIAQNIQKITQVLSQKISSMSQSLGNTSRQNSKQRPEDPQLHEQQVQNTKRNSKLNKKSSENKTHEISSDDDGEANIDGDFANDISAERPGNGPAQKIKLLHNIPKVSGSNLMIKTKAQMNNMAMQKQFMTLQNKNLNSQLRTGSGTRIQGGSQLRPSYPTTSTNPSILNSQQNNKRLSIKVLGQKKNTLAVQDANALKLNTNLINKGSPQQMQSQNQMRTPQQQAGATRLMPSSVNNFSMQNNMYHRALLQQQQQQQMHNQANYNTQPVNRQQPNTFGQMRVSASGAAGQGNVDKLQSNKILIAQQNIKNIQSSLIQRGSVSGEPNQPRKNNQVRGDNNMHEDNGGKPAKSPSAQSNGLNNTNCNVTASLNNISGISNILQNPAGNQGIASSQQQQLLAQQKNQMQQLMHEQQQRDQQINRLPISSQKFRQPMRIMKFKK